MESKTERKKPNLIHEHYHIIQFVTAQRSKWIDYDHKQPWKSEKALTPPQIGLRLDDKCYIIDEYEHRQYFPFKNFRKVIFHNGIPEDAPQDLIDMYHTACHLRRKAQMEDLDWFTCEMVTVYDEDEGQQFRLLAKGNLYSINSSGKIEYEPFSNLSMEIIERHGLGVFPAGTSKLSKIYNILYTELEEERAEFLQSLETENTQN